MSFRVKYVPIDDVRPHPLNPRRDHSVDRIATSIKAFGWRVPISVWEGDGHVLAGHGRLLAAKQLGLDKVPVHFVGKDELTAAEAAAYRLADNRSAEGASWEDELLLAQLDELGERERMLAGFDQAYRDELEWRLNAEAPPELDRDGEWEGMPEYIHEDKEAFRSVVVHMKDQEAVDAFARAVGHKITDRTRSIWYPQVEIERYADKRYAAVDG